MQTFVCTALSVKELNGGIGYVVVFLALFNGALEEYAAVVVVKGGAAGGVIYIAVFCADSVGRFEGVGLSAGGVGHGSYFIVGKVDVIFGEYDCLYKVVLVISIGVNPC